MGSQSLQTILQADFIAYAGISIADNATAQSIPNGATYTKMINFDAAENQRNATGDFANSQILPLADGVYSIDSSFSYKVGTNNTISYMALFVNGVEIENIHLTRKISTGGDIGSASFTGIHSMSSGDVVDIRIRHDNVASTDFTIVYANLNINKIDNV